MTSVHLTVFELERVEQVSWIALRVVVEELEQWIVVQLGEEEEELGQHWKVCSKKTWDQQALLVSVHVVSS